MVLVNECWLVLTSFSQIICYSVHQCGWAKFYSLSILLVSLPRPSLSPCLWRQTMRLEAGRLLGKQGTPLLPLGRGQLGGSGRQRGVSLKAGHTHPFHSPFIFVLRRKPLHYELETASHLICWLPHHQEKKEIGFCTLRLSLRDTSPDDALTKAKMLWNLDIRFKSFNPVVANGSLNVLDM